MADVFALIPDEAGNASIVEIGQLLMRLDDFETLDEAIVNSGIDYITDRDDGPLADALAKIRKLNAG